VTQLRRLCEAALADTRRELKRPPYDRRRLARGVVHLGPGAFHRAHQAAAFDVVAAQGDRRWGVVDVGVRSGAAARALAGQDGLFVLETRRVGEVERAVIGSVVAAVDASFDPRLAVSALAAPGVRLATLTVSEAAYTDASLGRLIADALALRQARNLGGLTLLSCDNLPSNGRRLRALVTAGAAAARGVNLAEWISRACAFPSSVVDRITPAASEADRARLAAETNLIDEALTITEPCSQWVIEDAFVGERPPLEVAGVVFVSDVSAFAAAKLRLLNGAHSALAWLGLLAGFSFVHEAFADPALRGFVDALWDEAEATLTRVGGLDLAAYRSQIASRFDNAALPHRLDQIATDGATKLTPRILEPMSARLARGWPVWAQALCVAAWAKAQLRHGGAGRFSFADAQEAAISSRLAGVRDARAAIEALVGLDSAIPRSLGNDPAFRSAVLAAADSLDRDGPIAASARAARPS
jgi:fructuronate reductase